jgi:hypothetical protein
MSGRRDVIKFGAAFAGLAPPPSTTPPAPLSFDITRDGGHVGEHHVDFREDANLLVATIAVEIVVRLGPIALYRYNHSAREAWRDGQFQELTSETNDDGKRFQVKVFRENARIHVDIPSRPRAVMPVDTIPLTHWNVQCMRQPLINPQDGSPIVSRIVPRGAERVASAGGQTVPAQRYSLVGDVTLDDWYDSAMRWAALRTKAKDGSMVEYRRVA